MKRKSQLEKWEARHGKIKKDDDIIREQEAKKIVENATLEKRGEQIAKTMGMSTEDIFMIIARDSVGTWMRMWNNSMETVLREMIRNELPAIIKQIVQEELASAARGFAKGLVPEPEEVAKIMKQELLSAFNPLQQMDSEIKAEKEPNESYSEAFASKLNEMKEDALNLLQPETFNSDDEIKAAIIEAHEAGVNVEIAKNFKTFTPRSNTLYQRFGKLNKGANRGAFSRYAEQVIFEHENAEYELKQEQETEEEHE